MPTAIPPEILPLNVYDSIAPGLITSATTRLFGKLNIGDTRLTDLQMPSTIVPLDYSALLQNWYARTDIDLPSLAGAALDAWTDWIHSTNVVLMIGAMPAHLLSLSDLLGRRQGQRDWAGRRTMRHAQGASHDPVTLGLAQAAFRQYQEHFAKCTDFVSGEMSDRYLSPPMPWEEALQGDRDNWMQIVEFLRARLEAPLLGYVPRRQTCNIQVHTSMPRLGRVLELVPNIRDRLIWIHLEGVQVRASEI